MNPINRKTDKTKIQYVNPCLTLFGLLMKVRRPADRIFAPDGFANG